MRSFSNWRCDRSLTAGRTHVRSNWRLSGNWLNGFFHFSNSGGRHFHSGSCGSELCGFSHWSSDRCLSIVRLHIRNDWRLNGNWLNGFFHFSNSGGWRHVRGGNCGGELCSFSNWRSDLGLTVGRPHIRNDWRLSGSGPSGFFHFTDSGWRHVHGGNCGGEVGSFSHWRSDRCLSIGGPHVRNDWRLSGNWLNGFFHFSNSGGWRHVRGGNCGGELRTFSNWRSDRSLTIGGPHVRNDWRLSGSCLNGCCHFTGSGGWHHIHGGNCGGELRTFSHWRSNGSLGCSRFDFHLRGSGLCGCFNHGSCGGGQFLIRSERNGFFHNTGGSLYCLRGHGLRNFCCGRSALSRSSGRLRFNSAQSLRFSGLGKLSFRGGLG